MFVPYKGAYPRLDLQIGETMFNHIANILVKWGETKIGLYTYYIHMWYAPHSFQNMLTNLKEI